MENDEDEAAKSGSNGKKMENEEKEGLDSAHLLFVSFSLSLALLAHFFQLKGPTVILRVIT